MFVAEHLQKLYFGLPGMKPIIGAGYATFKLEFRRITRKKNAPSVEWRIDQKMFFLMYYFQFINNIFSSAQFVNAPEYISDIYTNGAVKVFIKLDFMA